MILELLLFNVVVLFGMYTGLRLRFKRLQDEKSKEQNVRALGLLLSNYDARNGPHSLNTQCKLLDKFEKECDELIEGLASQNDFDEAENVMILAKYRDSNDRTRTAG